MECWEAHQTYIFAKKKKIRDALILAYGEMRQIKPYFFKCTNFTFSTYPLSNKDSNKYSQASFNIWPTLFQSLNFCVLFRLLLLRVRQSWNKARFEHEPKLKIGKYGSRMWGRFSNLSCKSWFPEKPYYKNIYIFCQQF